MKDEEKYVWVKFFTYLVISIVIISLAFFTLGGICESKVSVSHSRTYQIFGVEFSNKEMSCNALNLDTMIAACAILSVGILMLPMRTFAKIHNKYYKLRR